MASPYSTGRSTLQAAGTRAKQGPVNYSGTGAGMKPAQAPVAAAPAPRPSPVPQQQPAPARQVANRPFAMSGAQYAAQRQPAPPAGMPPPPVRQPGNVQPPPGFGGPVKPQAAAPLNPHAQFNQRLLASAGIGNVVGMGGVHPSQGLAGAAQPAGAAPTDDRGTYQRGQVQSDLPGQREVEGEVSKWIGPDGKFIDTQSDGTENTVGPTTGADLEAVTTPWQAAAPTIAGGAGGGSGGMNDAIANLFKTITDTAVAPATGISESFNDATKGQLGSYYDNYEDLDGMKNAAAGMFDPAAQAAADAAQRQQLLADVNSQRDDALRMQQGQASRGGRLGSGSQQGIYNSAMEAQAKGTRELMQDQYARMLGRNQLAGQLAGDAARTKYATMNEGFTDPREIASMMMEVFGAGGDKASEANQFAMGPLGWLAAMGG